MALCLEKGVGTTALSGCVAVIECLFCASVAYICSLIASLLDEARLSMPLFLFFFVFFLFFVNLAEDAWEDVGFGDRYHTMFYDTM